MPAIIFRYAFYGDRFSPVIPIGVKSPSGWEKVWAYLDSGSIYPIFQEVEANRLDINIKDGEKKFVKVGDGDIIPIYLHRLVLQIGPRRINAEVGFSDKLKVGFNIIGRHGAFDRFKICFDDSKHIVSLEPKETT